MARKLYLRLILQSILKKKHCKCQRCFQNDGIVNETACSHVVVLIAWCKNYVRDQICKALKKDTANVTKILNYVMKKKPLKSSGANIRGIEW